MDANGDMKREVFKNVLKDSKHSMRLRAHVLYVVLATAVAAVVCLLYIHSYRTPSDAITPNVITQGTFGGVPITLELAQTNAAQEVGLGGRASIPDNYGMLFIFPTAGDYGFWMKGMKVPIDIFWLNDKGQVVTLKESVAPNTYPTVFYPTTDASYVLEAQAGFAHAHGITASSTLENLPAKESVL